MLRVHLSIHDVAPHSLEQTQRLLDTCSAQGIEQLMLLVIPGLDWSDRDLEQLHAWVRQGHLLAGHGWLHRIERIRNLGHRLHSLLLSRDVAEHLERPPEELPAFMLQNYDWFARQELPSPRHYVPPAWALGRISAQALEQLPFQSVEATTGIYFRGSGWKRMPVTGYEADTALRQMLLRMSNALAWFLSSPKRPLRISLHPYDLDLRLQSDILQHLDQKVSWVADPDDLFPSA